MLLCSQKETEKRRRAERERAGEGKRKKEANSLGPLRRIPRHDTLLLVLPRQHLPLQVIPPLSNPKLKLLLLDPQLLLLPFHLLEIVRVMERFRQPHHRPLVRPLRVLPAPTFDGSEELPLSDVGSDEGGVEVVEGFEVGADVGFGGGFGDSEGGFVGVVGLHSDGVALGTSDEGGLVTNEFVDDVREVDSLSSDGGGL